MDATMRVLVNIDVPDLTAAIAFYEAAVGLVLRRRLDGDVAELAGGSSLVYLLQKAPGSVASRAAGTARDYARHWTPVHVDFVVADVEAAAARAVQAGAVRESACVEWRGSRCITLSDPFGNGFCFIEFDGTGYRDD